MSTDQSIINNRDKIILIPTMDNSRMMTQNDINETEMRLSDRFFNQQNDLDEKITNNMLKLNMVIYICTICLSCLFIFQSTEVFAMRPKVDLDQLANIYNPALPYYKITFSLFYFTTQASTESSLVNATNPYSCVYNTTTCENNCKNISMQILKDTFPLECNMFSNFNSAGIIVKLFYLFL